MLAFSYLVGLVIMRVACEQNDETMLWAGALVSIISGVAIVL